MGAKNVENVHNVTKTPNAKKVSKVTELAIRRSVRINSSGNLRVSPIVEHVNLVENEPEGVNSSPLMKENDSEREPQAQQANTPEMNGRSLEEKVDYLIRTADELKSKVAFHSLYLLFSIYIYICVCMLMNEVTF